MLSLLATSMKSTKRIIFVLPTFLYCRGAEKVLALCFWRRWRVVCQLLEARLTAAERLCAMGFLETSLIRLTLHLCEKQLLGLLKSQKQCRQASNILLGHNLWN